MGFGQFAATSQFYLYGKKHCTKTGYAAHRKKYAQPDFLESDMDLSGKVYLVTGANSGVGFEVAKYLAHRRATVHMVCRNPQRGNAAIQRIVESAPEGLSSEDLNVKLIQCDCGLEKDVRRAWSEFCKSSASTRGAPVAHGAGGGGGGGAVPRLDGIVCNAGALLNERTLTSEGVEVTFASHLLFGTYLFTKLALPSLSATPGSRVVVVSSGGMYNGRWPGTNVASSMVGTYDGNMAYVYAKRGQVLLCERWARMFPDIKFVTAHPGWVDTPAVTEAYGENRKYLEPMRNPWEGAEGIVWLCVADPDNIESGAFYLDRKPQVKHMAGPFFSEGDFTKNTVGEVDDMMGMLEDWSSADKRPTAPSDEDAKAADRSQPLQAMSRPIDIEPFMGRWYVNGVIPTYFELGATNCVEDYTWDPKRKAIQVAFTYNTPGKSSSSLFEQRAKIVSDNNTRWSICPKLGVYLPLNLAYLVLDCAEDYSYTIIGVPDRSYLWIMSRDKIMDPATMAHCFKRAAQCGYDVDKILPVQHDGMPPQVLPTASAAAEEPPKKAGPTGAAEETRGMSSSAEVVG